MKNVGRTRWVELFNSIISCLESIIVNEETICNKETSTKASSFYKLIASFDFLATLVLARSIRDLTLPVTELLQGKEINMADASHLLDSLKIAILAKLYTIDDFHNNCYRIILEVANKIIINKTKPRTAAFQLHVPSEPVFDYFKMAVTVPQLNNLLTQLNARSNIASAMVYGGLII